MRGKVKELSAFINKLETCNAINITTYIKSLEQKDTNTLKRTSRQEIIKLKAKINKVEIKRTIQRINET